MQILGAGPAYYAIDRCWCDTAGFFIEGRIDAGAAALHRLRVIAGARHYDILQFSKTDQAAARTAGSSGGGFALYMPWRAGERIVFEVETEASISRHEVHLPGSSPVWSRPFCLTDGSTDLPNPPPDNDDDALVDFLTEVRRRGAGDPRQRIAEIGARAVSENWTTMRPWFENFGDYVGIDIHPGVNVDLVGDAHYMHELVGAGTLDAAFSLSVMEHLAYPWLYAQSVNSSLRVGGLTFQATHQSWPIHAAPTDFWRFSDEALKLLFGKQMGFEVIRAGFKSRLCMHPELLRPTDVRMPWADAWGGVYVYARKIADLPEDAVKWPTGRQDSRDLAASYPKSSD